MKLCKDCKWVVGNDEFAKCSNPNTINPNEAATGFPSMNYCSTARLFGFLGAWITNNCGINARYWEPKE